MGCAARALTITNATQTYLSLLNTDVTLAGRAELYLTASTNPVTGSTIHLESPDAWFFLPNIRPSVVVAKYLSQVRVGSAAASAGTNVRVDQFGQGTVIIPHPSSYTPLTVFSGDNFLGRSAALGLYTYYAGAALDGMNRHIGSFVLKRGYMATFARQADGGGFSKVYIAQDTDLEVGRMPPQLDQQAGFVRVFPWRWTGKKGWAGAVQPLVEPSWSYDWDNVATSTLDSEYVPMRHNLYWDSYANVDGKKQSLDALGFNEPDQANQANMTVDQAITEWPNLMASGLRLGSPAPSDGGLNWLYSFIDRADALGYRVDYVAVHFYQGGWNAGQYYNWLQAIHQRTGRPIWITEFNNGANWTCCYPTLASQAQTISEFLDMLNGAPFVERYAIYNWVGDNRAMVAADGTLTPAGIVYRDKIPPLANVQAPLEGCGLAGGQYSFELDTRDRSGAGNNAMVYGIPSYLRGQSGNAISLDGSHVYLQVPAGTANTPAITVAAWVYWNGGSAGQRIFDFGNDPTHSLYLSPSSDTRQTRFAIVNGGAEQALVAPPLQVGHWTHVAATLGGSMARLYINGALAASASNFSILPSQINPALNYLGRGQSLAVPYLRGLLDETTIFSRVLYPSEIAALVSNTPPQFVISSLVRTGAIVGRAFGGSIAGTATDSDAGDSLTYSKVSGPGWLTITDGGTLLGTPAPVEGGTNWFTVRVTDSTGASDLALLGIGTETPPGPVVRYEFDGNLASSVAAPDAVLNGPPRYVPGHDGQAIVLDGATNYITLPPGIVSSSEFTAAMWVNWDGGAGGQRLFSFGNSASEYLMLSPKFSGVLRFAITRSGAAGEQRLEGLPLATNQWIHLAVTMEGSSAILYVNGDRVASSDSFTLSPASLDPAFNYLGRGQVNEPFFKGRVDGFNIFNMALTPTQVKAMSIGRPISLTANPILASPGLAGQPYAANIAQVASGGVVTFTKLAGPSWLQIGADGALSGTPSASLPGDNRFTVRLSNEAQLGQDAILSINVGSIPGLAACYNFEGNVHDSAGTRHGILQGSAAYVPGVHGDAIVLDGAVNYVALPQGIASYKPITIATRVNWAGGAMWQRIFDFGNNTSQYFFLTPRSGDNTLRFAIASGSSAVEQRLETTQLPSNQWVHLAVVLDGTTGRLYVDGKPVATGPVSFSPAVLRTVNNYLGKSQFPDPLFRGSLDDFQIYHTALSDADIAALANPELVNAPFRLMPANGAAGKFTVPGLAGRFYTLFRSPTLSPPVWSPVASEGPLNTEGTATFSDPAPSEGGAFYRGEVKTP